MKTPLPHFLVVIWLSVLAWVLGVEAECINRVDPCDPNVSYFPNVPEFDYSSTVKSVIKNNTSVSLTLQIDSFGKMRHYLLVRCGCPPPELDNPNTTVIHVPVGSILLSDLKSFSKFDKLLEPKQELVNISLYTPNNHGNDQMTLPSGAKINLRNNIFYNDNNVDVFIIPWDSVIKKSRWPIFSDTDSLETSETNKAALTQLYGLLLGKESKVQSEKVESTSPKESDSVKTSSPGSETWKIIGIVVAVTAVASIALVFVWRRWSRTKTDDEAFSPQHPHRDNVDTGGVPHEPPLYENATIVQHVDAGPVMTADEGIVTNVPPPYKDIGLPNKKASSTVSEKKARIAL